MDDNHRESGRKLEAIINTAIDGIITIDRYGTMETVNPAAARLFGYDASDLVGKNVSMLMPQPDRGRHDGYIENYLRTGDAKIIGIGREVQGMKKDGTIFPMRLAVSQVQLEDRIMFTGIVHDLTELRKAGKMVEKLNRQLQDKVEERTRKLQEVINQLLVTNTRLEEEIVKKERYEKALHKREDELKKSLEREKELGELKSRFMSMASHEFRTPLSTIKSSATLISRYQLEEQSDKRLKHVERIKKTVDHLTGVLTDFLSLNRLEEGKVELKLEKVELYELFEEISEELTALMKEKQRINLPPQSKGFTLKTDRRILKNILYNLISNATKYSDRGQEVDIRFTAGKPEVRIDVVDRGYGIPKSDQKHLFTRFFRATNVTNIQGTGLGLAIVRRYLQLLDGRLDFESEEDIGSRFTIFLPLNNEQNEKTVSN